MDFRDRILIEIKRLAETNGGRAPGRLAFQRATGIKIGQWSGVIWARWGDALAEAGFAPNQLNPRHDTEEVLTRLVDAVRHYGKLPTFAELKLYRQRNPGFPNDKTVASHFHSRPAMVAALKRRAAEDPNCADVLPLLPDEVPEPDAAGNGGSERPTDGWVYLIKSGSYYKIGRGEDLERRVKEIRVALPEAGSLIHAIRTDDPAGIEAYWHRRFTALRANGEWFRLTPSDVSAFKRRKFQ